MRLALHAQNVSFVLLFLATIALLALLGERYRWQFDWTVNQRNTLADASARLLERMEGPIHIRAFARENEAVRRAIRELVERYQRIKSDVTLEFSNPDRIPQEVRSLDITVAGELIVSYREGDHHVTTLTEASLTNALQRLVRAHERWLAHLTGHGERNWAGGARHDYGIWATLLAQTGLKIRRLELGENGAIPDNTSTLALSQGRVELAPHEIGAITRFLEGGGNLLWLADPAERRDLDWLAGQLGLEFLPGTVVDPAGDNPTFIEVSTYSSHPATRQLTAATWYPVVAAIAWEAPPGWTTTGILGTGLRVWSESGQLGAELAFDRDRDVAGPLDIAVAMQRRVGDKQQRVVVIGDGDFLSNAYLGAGANLDLGMNIINWLLGDDELIDIPSRFAIDLQFEPSRAARLLIALGVPFGVPILLLAAGGWIWQRRRRR